MKRIGPSDQIIGIGVLAVFAFPAIFDPMTAEFFPPCVFRLITGWQCPGCGSARAIHALIHGDVIAAMRANCFAVVALPFATTDVVQRIRGLDGLRTAHWHPIAIGAIVAAIALFGIIRNVIPPIIVSF